MEDFSEIMLLGIVVPVPGSRVSDVVGLGYQTDEDGDVRLFAKRVEVSKNGPSLVGCHVVENKVRDCWMHFSKGRTLDLNKVLEGEENCTRVSDRVFRCSSAGLRLFVKICGPEGVAYGKSESVLSGC